jgi:hypothetical protein
MEKVGDFKFTSVAKIVGSILWTSLNLAGYFSAIYKLAKSKLSTILIDIGSVTMPILMISIILNLGVL